MKLKSLILGSVAAAGLSTAAFAADPAPTSVLTSLSVCDTLGLSGLTISSRTNCLQISGNVAYEFKWGDYAGTDWFGETGWRGDANDIERDLPNYFMGTPAVTEVRTPVLDADGVPTGEYIITTPGAEQGPANEDANHDWQSTVTAWLRFVATADSDFGPAVAVIKLNSRDRTTVVNEQTGTTSGDGADNSAWGLNQAYVQIGDLSATTFYAGKKGTIAKTGNDEGFDWLGGFRDDEVDGVRWPNNSPRLGGHVIQVVHNLGNGIDVAVGLERLEDTTAGRAGTLVGSVGYSGGGINAHVTGAVGGILDGEPDWYAIHAGATGTFDKFRVRGAFAAQTNVANDTSFWNGLVSAQATFDMFRIAATFEADGRSGFATNDTNFGVSGSVTANVASGVEINLGGRFYRNTYYEEDTYQVAASVSASLTETLRGTVEVGVYGLNDPSDNYTDWYATGELAWNPGGGFTSSIAGSIQENGAYSVTFKAAKAFQ